MHLNGILCEFVWTHVQYLTSVYEFSTHRCKYQRIANWKQGTRKFD